MNSLLNWFSKAFFGRVFTLHHATTRVSFALCSARTYSPVLKKQRNKTLGRVISLPKYDCLLDYKDKFQRGLAVLACIQNNKVLLNVKDKNIEITGDIFNCSYA